MNSNLPRFMRRGLDHFRFISVWVNSHDLLRADGGNWRRRALRGKRCGRVASSSTVGGTAWSLSATHHLPPVNMAALTFNPLVLSAKASVRGAAVRRSVAVKASKKAAFAVRADDDMDFVSGFRPRPFPCLFSTRPGAPRVATDCARGVRRASRERRGIFRRSPRANPRRARRLPPPRATPARFAWPDPTIRGARSRRRVVPSAASPRAPHPPTTRD